MKILLHRTLLGVAAPCLAGLALTGPGVSQVEAAARGKAQAAPAIELILPLEKLTTENAKRVEAALRDISHQAWECPACRHVESGPGFCLDCDEDLVARAEPVRTIRKLQTDLEARTLRVALAPGRELRLSEVEKALKPSGVTIRRSELRVLPWSRIELGAPGIEDAEALFDALAIAALPLEVADIETDDERDHVSLQFGRARGGVGATLDEVKTALSGSDPSITFADLVWTGPCRVCDRQGATVAACRQCTVRLYEDEG